MHSVNAVGAAAVGACAATFPYHASTRHWLAILAAAVCVPTGGCGRLDDWGTTGGVAYVLPSGLPGETRALAQTPAVEVGGLYAPLCFQYMCLSAMGDWSSEPLVLTTIWWDVGTLSALWNSDSGMVLGPEVGIWSWDEATAGSGGLIGLRAGWGRVWGRRGLFFEWRWLVLFRIDETDDVAVNTIGVRCVW